MRRSLPLNAANCTPNLPVPAAGAEDVAAAGFAGSGLGAVTDAVLTGGSMGSMGVNSGTVVAGFVDSGLSVTEAVATGVSGGGICVGVSVCTGSDRYGVNGGSAVSRGVLSM